MKSSRDDFIEEHIPGLKEFQLENLRSFCKYFLWVNFALVAPNNITQAKNLNFILFIYFSKYLENNIVL